MTPRVAVVGAGIAGLAAALQLAGRAEVTVYEGADRVGGKLRTGELAGIAVDEGAEAVLVRSPELAELAGELGLAGELVHPAASSASIYSRGRLRPLPARTVMGVPGDLRALAGSGVLAPADLARVAADLVLPPSRPVAGDVDVARAVGRRLGAGVVDRLVEPLLGGVYAGRADHLSLSATLPALAGAARSGRSMLRAARAALPPRRGPGEPPAPVFGTLTRGLGALTERLCTRLSSAGVTVRTSCPVTDVQRSAEGFRLRLGNRADPEFAGHDAVILACPAVPAARLIADVAPAASADLGAIEYASVAIVSFAFPAPALPRLSGSGFLVPAVEGLTIKAATFSSNKWAHLGGDVFLARCSIGRYGDTADLQRDDEDLVRIALADLGTVTGITASPVAARVTRWGGGLPQYAVGHLDRVRRIRAALAAVPGLTACGAVYEGVGIPACIRSGRAAAEEVVRNLITSGGN